MIEEEKDCRVVTGSSLQRTWMKGRIPTRKGEREYIMKVDEALCHKELR